MIEVNINQEDFEIPAGRIAEIVIVISNRGDKKEEVTFKILSTLEMKDCLLYTSPSPRDS